MKKSRIVFLGSERDESVTRKRLAPFLVVAVLLTGMADGRASAAAPRLSASAGGSHPFIRASNTRTLHDQTGGDSGVGMNSQNYEPEFDAYDDQAADDFIVPEAVRWKITEVDVIGNYYDGAGDAYSMNVVFYKDKRGAPGRIVREFNGLLDPGDGWGTFAFDLGTGLRLRSGHYWMSVQANQNFNTDGQWEWEATESVVNGPAMWRNPGDAFGIGCTDWTDETVCLPESGRGGHLFALKGRSR